MTLATLASDTTEPFFLLDHDARRVLHPQERAVHVDVEHPPHLGGAHVPDVRHLASRDAGVVDHNVQRTEPRRRRVHSAAHLLLDRDVAVDEHDALTVASEGVAQLLAGVVLDVRDADLGAVLLEEAYDEFAHAIGAAGDQGDHPFQPAIQKDIFCYRNRCRLVSARTVVSRYQQGSCRG
jgi:hypothetical protein